MFDPLRSGSLNQFRQASLAKQLSAIFGQSKWPIPLRMGDFEPICRAGGQIGFQTMFLFSVIDFFVTPDLPKLQGIRELQSFSKPPFCLGAMSK